MYKNNKILAIIPARGGSKGLPRKNVMPLYGKPLIAWTIECAQKSIYLDKTIVSSDDREIIDLATKYGADVPFRRPKELAEDTTPIFKVILHAIDFLESESIFFDYIALLEPTSPLRKKDDIDNAITQLINCEKEADSLVSVGEIHTEHPSIAKKVCENYVKSYEPKSKNIYRRQDLDKAFFPYGVIYISKIPSFMQHKTFYQERTIPYFLERWQNYEVDDFYDLICIESILKYKT